MRFGKDIEEVIDCLLVCDEAKNILRTVGKLANSDVDEVRKSVPSLFVVADAGTGITTYCKAYSEIIDASGLYKIKCSKTYIELVFPPVGAVDKDRKRFFQSAKLAASITNKYYGTFVISLSEWKGQDLLKDDSFVQLLEFIDANKDNICFCFHVLPAFSAKNELRKIIFEHINVIDVVLDMPNVDKSTEYVVRGLEKFGYRMKTKAISELKESVVSDIVNGERFAGYRTLNQITRRLCFEMALLETSGNKIDRDVVVALEEKLKDSMNQNDYIVPMGFHN